MRQHRLVSAAPLCLAAAVSLLAGSGAHAQAPDVRADYGLRFGAGYSDNAFRTQINQESSSYKAMGLFFDVVRDGTRFDSTFTGDVERRNYSDPNIPNEPVGSINARIDVEVVPERFAWRFDDSYGQGRVNPFQVIGPTNRQEINVFSTGPQLTLPLGSRTSMRLNGTHERRRFDNTGQLDSDSDEVLLGVFRSVSQTTEVGLSWIRREITYSDVLPDWNDDTVFLSYRRQLATGSAAVSIGENSVSIAGAETSGPLFEADWTRQLGSRSELRVGARRDFIDPGQRFLNNNTVGNVGPLGPTDVFLGAGVYEYSEVSVGNTTEFVRTTVAVGMYAGKNRYDSNAALDSDESRAYVSVERTIGPEMFLGLAATVYETEYLTAGNATDDELGQLWLRKEFGRRLSLQFAYSHYSRDAQGFTANSYDENIYQVTLGLDLNP
jgi:hypothetical protein